MNASAAQIVAAVHLFIRHQQQSPCSVLIWRGQLICIVDVFVDGSILQPMDSWPPAVHVCGGLMFSVNFVLGPSNLLHLVPSSLTLWPELDNGRLAGLMDGAVVLLPACCCCGFPDTKLWQWPSYHILYLAGVKLIHIAMKTPIWWTTNNPLEENVWLQSLGIRVHLHNDRWSR